ncbi:MAG: hypothetical protein AB8H03_21755 [Saprospiraceae bacterium]
MEKLILDTPFRDSYSDFLEKGETIVWKDSAIDPKYAVVPVKKKLFNFNRNEILIIILAGFFLGIYIVFYDKLAASGTSFLVIVLLLLLNVFHKQHYKNHIAEFALSTKRILIKSNHSKDRVIYEIPFSQLNNCIVEEKKSGRGTIFLDLKNPAEIQFKTFTIIDNGEIEKRHQPTLENIEDPQAVAKLIREGIKNANISL